MPERVEPAYLWVPERAGSYGDEAVDLARLVGRELDAEQQLAVDALLSYGPGGRWLALESAVVEARQNGKTGGVLLPVVLFDLFLLGADRIVWTAHLFRTARDAFADFCGCIDRAPELSRRVKKITYANGEESIELMSGARLEFLARSKGGGRGLGGKRLVMDEALFLSAESMGALIPTLSARQDPQINYGSSAGVATSDHLRALRDRGRAGGDGSLIWVEWCAPGGWVDPPCAAGVRCTHAAGSDGCALDDEALWPLANPALGRRITFEYVRAERRALPPAEFGRERLGWFDEPLASVRVIAADVWASLADAGSQAQDPLAFAVDATPDQSFGAIGVAGRRADDLLHIEVVEHRAGMSWMVPRILELHERWKPCAWVIDPKRQANVLIPELEAAGIEVVKTSARDMAQACGGLYAAATDSKTLRHLDQPELNAALARAQKRELEGAWAWDGRTGVDISPLVVVTLAAWGHATRAHIGEQPFFGAWR